MSEIVKRVDQGHFCGVTRIGTWDEWQRDDSWPGGGYRSPLYDAPGTVRACEGCGRTWVAMSPPPGLCPSVWRPEGRFERWRRERKPR